MTATSESASGGASARAVLRKNTRLAFDLAKRSIFGRYRETVLGVGWSVVQPLVLLAIYSFVFSRVFEARWDVGAGNRANFAVILFSGLLLFNFFNEAAVNSTAVVMNNRTLIKRTSVASTILPVSVVVASMLTFALASIPFVAGYAWTIGLPPISVLWLPVILLPLTAMVLGLSFLIAALSVYIRDMQPVVMILSTLVLFLSPIFYPASAIPEQFRGIVLLSPIGVPLMESKAVLFVGEMPNWFNLSVYGAVALGVVAVGHWIYRRAQSGFADVL